MVEPDAEDLHAFGMSTIRELIQAELDDGASFRDLERNSGGRVSFQTFQQLSKTPPKGFPKDTGTITGMAIALKVPETTIVLAYASSLGIAVRARSEFSLRLPANIDELTPDMRDALLAIARAALAGGTSADGPKRPPFGRPRGGGEATRKDRPE